MSVATSGRIWPSEPPWATVRQSWSIALSCDTAPGPADAGEDDAASAGALWRGVVPALVDDGAAGCAEAAGGFTPGRGDCGRVVMTTTATASPAAAPNSPAAVPAAASVPARRVRSRPAAP